MKISKPRIDAKLDEGSLDDLLEGEPEDVLLRDIDATNSHITSLDMSGTVLEKTLMTASHFERLVVRDVRFDKCDLSAVAMNSGEINRAEFVNCRMTGVDFNKTTLHDITFRGCKLDMANFRFTNLRRVAFVDCTLAETDFLGATVHDVSFESCTLERTIFTQTKCKSLDLRTSELIEISGWASLRGAIIDSTQLVAASPYLANELGIIVR
jgi:uncharacterized protein YjbI with pentapeptide repeats